MRKSASGLLVAVFVGSVGFANGIWFDTQLGSRCVPNFIVTNDSVALVASERSVVNDLTVDRFDPLTGTATNIDSIPGNFDLRSGVEFDDGIAILYMTTGTTFEIRHYNFAGSMTVLTPVTNVFSSRLGSLAADDTTLLPDRR